MKCLIQISLILFLISCTYKSVELNIIDSVSHKAVNNVEIEWENDCGDMGEINWSQDNTTFKIKKKCNYYFIANPKDIVDNDYTYYVTPALKYSYSENGETFLIKLDTIAIINE